MSVTPGLLMVWMNIEPANVPTFDHWYTDEHIPERVGVPGFRTGCRYEAVRGDPRFFAAYDTDSPDVLSSAAYRERLEHPTPLTQQVMPWFRDTVRTPGRLLAEAGQGVGGILRTVRLEPAQGRREALRAALGGALVADLARKRGVVRVRAAEALGAAHSSDTAEIALRGRDVVASFVLLLDATDVPALEAACADLLAPAPLAALGTVAPPLVGDYRLLYGLSR